MVDRLPQGIVKMIPGFQYLLVKVVLVERKGATPQDMEEYSEAP